MPPGLAAAPENARQWTPVYPVAVLPYASLAVIETENATPATWPAGVGIAKEARGPATTVTARPVPLVWPLPSPTTMFTVSTLYNLITPLDAPLTAATPFVKLSGVAVPKVVAVPEELDTVGR